MKKVATDVGGTFTDLVFFDQKTNTIKNKKHKSYYPGDQFYFLELWEH